jgi:hypothetical protein
MTERKEGDILTTSFFLFSTYLPPCSPLLTTSLPSSSHSYSLPLSLLSLNPPPHYLDEGGREAVSRRERKKGERW